ncbi:alpha-amylase family glycosyl hydrolase [Flavobacterium sp.]|uniref:alpha-amylase family glycosyl hydrolase n=1 Tax=Flavobacterium sp. TaxID=239 RepID=UPI00260F3E7D|nr:alpha-amylase family glycosyl hydrolase [Flavobacterium sp.]
MAHKKVVYQVFTRLFGNTQTTNKPWGTKEENGVGKFNDFTDKALQEIKDLGVTHIWFTGVPHHALVADYTKFGISNDDPDVVKGRAGSPYAVKDYYNVNPDLAVDPSRRMEEFEALIQRAHQKGLQVIIDIVPNHIARNYHSISHPDYVKNFGVDDDVTQEYARNNNFYYIPGVPFQVPFSTDYKPLNGEKHPLIDGKFDENPAKWTGNGSRQPQPNSNDWYETVKVNYGVRPDGSKDFPELPDGFEKKMAAEHFEYWKTQDVPNSWWKFREIAEFWLAKGVDGFRYDMAEMVPVEFWSFMNSAIKMKNPNAFLLAEVYNPNEYRNYIFKGKMDYLYDKVETYDHLKAVIQGRTVTDGLITIRNRNKDIDYHMLHFLDNHDEQRLASPEFAGSGERGKPLMVVSTTLSSSPTMVYFGQEVGEPGNEDAGFGKRSRTSIFDYIGVPNHQRWMNHGKFDGGLLTEKEKALRDFYKRLLNFSIESSALMGNYFDLHTVNAQTAGYNGQQYAFARWSDTEKLIVVSNFDSNHSQTYTLKLPNELINLWHLKDGNYPVKDVLYGKTFPLKVKQGLGFIDLKLEGSESFILKL